MADPYIAEPLIAKVPAGTTKGDAIRALGLTIYDTKEELRQAGMDGKLTVGTTYYTPEDESHLFIWAIVGWFQVDILLTDLSPV